MTRNKWNFNKNNETSILVFIYLKNYLIWYFVVYFHHHIFGFILCLNCLGFHYFFPRFIVWPRIIYRGSIPPTSIMVHICNFSRFQNDASRSLFCISPTWWGSLLVEHRSSSARGPSDSRLRLIISAWKYFSFKMNKKNVKLAPYLSFQQFLFDQGSLAMVQYPKRS